MAVENLNIIKMHFIRPLHLGQEGDSIETVEQMCHSDTLFSAICHSWLKLYGENELKSMLDEFQRAGENDSDPPFRLSSAFPFVTMCNNSVYYLPKPQIPPPFRVDFEHPRSAEIGEMLKPLKDVNWITQEFFELWINADKKELKIGDIPSDVDRNYKKIETNAQRVDSFIRTTVRPRVALDSVTREPRYFSFGMSRYAEGSGSYFMIKWREQDKSKWEPKLLTAMRLLGDIGLGGERSSGYGCFNIECSNIEIKVLDSSNGLVTLSLWYPNNQDITQGIELNQYNLLHRAGWSFSQLLKKAYRRKVVIMFAEGSTVRRELKDSTGKLRGKITGRLADVTPDDLLRDGGHDVYRNGFAFTLPVVL